MAPEAIIPTYHAVSICGAVIACALGAHATLVLGSAAVRLGRTRLIGLAALTFAIQCIFTMHFMAISGLEMGRTWGFDILWIVGSLLCVLVFGTAGTSLALKMRLEIEADVQRQFPGYKSPGTGLQRHLLRYILARLSAWKLVLCAILLLMGLAGCLHAGMWSIHGVDGTVLHCRALYESAGLTLGIGGATCMMAVVIFVLLPQGWLFWFLGLTMVVGLVVYQYSSTMWGFGCFKDVPGLSLGYTIDRGFVVIILILQASVSLTVSILFSKVAVDGHLTAQQELLQAQRLVYHLAHMDLAAARRIQKDSTLGIPSSMATSLYQIMGNLELFRPYLPDALFSGKEPQETVPLHPQDTLPQMINPEDSSPPSGNQPAEAAESSRDSSQSFNPLGPGPLCPRKSVWTERQRTWSRDRTNSQSPHGNPRSVSPKRLSLFGNDAKVARNAALGLKIANMTVLHVKLQNVDFNGAQLNIRKVEEELTEFMLMTTREIKLCGGTIVQCSGEVTIAMWQSRSPQNALHCAAAIQQSSKQIVTQVVQCGQFLAGNLGDEKTRAYNVVGPLQTLSQLLIPLASSKRNDILITDQERETAIYEFCCLPYERIWVAGTAQTVYAMVPYPKGENQDDDEWIYKMQSNLDSLAQDKVSEVWDAYSTGEYRTARHLIGQLAKQTLPSWYPDHLNHLLDEAIQHGTTDPIKCLENFAWSMYSSEPSHRPRGKRTHCVL